MTPAVAFNSTCTHRDNRWHVDFFNFRIENLLIFLHHVRNGVDTGIVMGMARREIIQILRTYMTAHTIYPISEQYKTVCSKLVF